MHLQKHSEDVRKDNNRTNKLTAVLFIIYMVALFWIVLFKLGVPFRYLGRERSINLIPFSKPLILNGKADFGEAILNILIFVPFGIYAGVLFERWTAGKKLFLFFFVSLMCEVFQFIFRIGASDITDIITNTLGGIIGFIVFKAIEKVFNNRVESQKFINIIAVVGTVLMVSLLVLLKLNRLPVRFQ